MRTSATVIAARGDRRAGRMRAGGTAVGRAHRTSRGRRRPVVQAGGVPIVGPLSIQLRDSGGSASGCLPQDDTQSRRSAIRSPPVLCRFQRLPVSFWTEVAVTYTHRHRSPRCQSKTAQQINFSRVRSVRATLAGERKRTHAMRGSRVLLPGLEVRRFSRRQLGFRRQQHTCRPRRPAFGEGATSPVPS